MAAMFLHKLKHRNGAKGWLIPDEAFKISDGAMFIDYERYELQSNKANYFSLNTGIRLQSLCIPPVNTILHDSQVEVYEERGGDQGSARVPLFTEMAT